MKTIIKVVLIINASMFLLGGILLGFGLLLGGKLQFGFVLNENKFQESKYVDGEIALSNFDEMDIDLSSLELIIEESDVSKVEYHVLEGYEPEVKVENNKLSIIQDDTKFDIKMGFYEESEYVRVYATKEQLAKINLKSGSIKVYDIDLTGDVATTSGSIIIDNSKGENLNVKANSGSMKLSNLEYNTLTTEQTSRSSNLSNVNAKTLDCKSVSGSRTLENVVSDEISMSVTSGETKINKVEADKIKIDGGSGSIKADDCKIGDFVSDSTSGSVKIANSTLDNADIKLNSGEIKLELNGNEADYGYDIEKGSGSIKINGARYDDDLQKSGNTDKMLKLKSTSGSINIEIN